MSYLGKLAIGLVVVSALAGIATVATRRQTSPGSTAAAMDSGAEDDPCLTFPTALAIRRETLVVGSPNPHTYDFWFENRNSVPIDMALMFTGCRCADAAMCLFSPEEAIRYRRWLLAAAASRTSSAAGGTLSLLTGLHAEQGILCDEVGYRPEWHPVHLGAVPAGTVPAMYAGLFRAITQNEWNQETSRRAAFGVGSRPYDSNGPWHVHRLEINTALVHPLRLPEASVEVGELSAGQEKSVSFPCWSSTLADFDLAVEVEMHDPCFRFSWIRLGEEQKQRLANATHLPVLSGYEVQVTVRERISEKTRMEWGKFARQLVLRGVGIPQQSHITLTGTVRGEVIPVGDRGQDVLSFGRFSSAAAAVATMRLVCQRDNLKLRWDGSEPSDLKFIRLKSLRKLPSRPDGKAEWELAIEIPAGTYIGELPPSCAVYVKAYGDAPGRLRIPVTGIGNPG